MTARLLSFCLLFLLVSPISAVLSPLFKVKHINCLKQKCSDKFFCETCMWILDGHSLDGRYQYCLGKDRYSKCDHLKGQ